MRKLVFALALAILASPALAKDEPYLSWKWECDDIIVEMKKLAVHHTELTFTGKMTMLSVTGKPTTAMHLKWFGENGAILNGKRCEFLGETELP